MIGKIIIFTVGTAILSPIVQRYMFRAKVTVELYFAGWFVSLVCTLIIAKMVGFL